MRIAMFRAKKAMVFTLALMMVLGFYCMGPSVYAAGERFVLVSHAPDSDSWWNTIKNAIKVAGEQMDVKVEYRNPPTGDLADMARIVEQAVASNPNGLIVTIADFDVLSGPIEKAVRKGIPVITINSGTHEQSRKLGALLHVGSRSMMPVKGPGSAPRTLVSPSFCVSTTTSPIPHRWNVARALQMDSALSWAIK